MQPDDLGHGFTIADAYRLADVAARTHYAGSLPVDERTAVARFGVVTTILKATERPADRDLLAAARDAISAATAAEYQAHGLTTRDLAKTNAGFASYWQGSGRNSSPFEDAIVDAVALGQIWEILPARYCRDLQALADHDDYRAAADALGTTYATYKVRLSQARAAFREWWFEHETPPGAWGNDRRSASRRTHSVNYAIRARARDRAATTKETAPNAA